MHKAENRRDECFMTVKNVLMQDSQSMPQTPLPFPAPMPYQPYDSSGQPFYPAMATDIPTPSFCENDDDDEDKSESDDEYKHSQ